jgi:gamma-glutamylcyclotransferase (GGCT)/AIG2-like uncharacterized protein YtfP
MKTLIVAYGTLMDWQQPEWETLGTRSFSGSMYDLGNFPGVVTLEGENTFEADIMRIPVNYLPSLDQYEGVPSLYQRLPISTDFGPASIYIFQPDVPEGATLINSWRNR